MAKEQKVKDFTELTLRMEEEPWVLSDLHSQLLGWCGIYLAVGSFLGLLLQMWACGIGLALGVACCCVWRHDHEIRSAGELRKKVLEGPSEELQASAARPLRPWSFVALPCVVGAICMAFLAHDNVPMWLFLILMAVGMFLTGAFQASLEVALARSERGKIMAYRRSIPVYAVGQSSYDAVVRGIERIQIEGELSDLYDLLEKHNYDPHNVVQAMESAKRHAETILADEEQSESWPMAWKVLERVEIFVAYPQIEALAWFAGVGEDGMAFRRRFERIFDDSR